MVAHPIVGAFKFIKPLASGGMGVVWLGMHVMQRVEVAANHWVGFVFAEPPENSEDLLRFLLRILYGMRRYLSRCRTIHIKFAGIFDPSST